MRRTARSRIAWGPILSGGGAYLFALTCAELLKPLFSPSYGGDAATNRLALQFAGFLVTGGWLVDRWEQRLWPFNRPVFARAVKRACSRVVSAAAVIVGSLSVAAVILLLLKLCLR